MNNKPVVFNNTVLRDGHQSLAATRMQTEDMLPVCEILDGMGFGALETWGGATIDSGLRFLGEFPFKRLDALKKACPKTKHMMLFRGQNIVGYTHYADDVVTAFVNCSAKHGMDIFRIFDALNDTRNMECSIKAVKAAGKEAHGTICYTSSPFHTTEKFIEMGKELEKLGCDAIVLKDMAGLVPPYVAYEIISGLKKNIKIPVIFHTHDTTGLGATAYYSAIVSAGVDAVDVSCIPFANGTGQPDCSRMIHMLENNERKPAYDLDKLAQVRKLLQPIYSKLGAYTMMENEVIDSDALNYQVPGGMLSNFRVQLKEMKMEDKFDEVFAEVPYVREKLGWIPLVTPTSQIVGTQAMLNVKFGRWKNFNASAVAVALGYYGRTPAPVDAEVRKIAIEAEEKLAKGEGREARKPIDCRPADLIKPGMENLRAKLKASGLPTDDEHCVIYAMFPQQLEDIYKKPASAFALKPAPQKNAVQLEPKGNKNMYRVSIDGKSHDVSIQELA